MRMRNRRILPATWPRTVWPLSSSTRNIALGSASTTSPSSSTFSSLGMSAGEASTPPILDAPGIVLAVRRAWHGFTAASSPGTPSYGRAPILDAPGIVLAVRRAGHGFTAASSPETPSYGRDSVIDVGRGLGRGLVEALVVLAPTAAGAAAAPAAGAVGLEALR